MSMTGRIKNNIANISRQYSPLPIIGKVKVGERKMSASGKLIPTSLDYFVFRGNYEREANYVYGDKPTKLGITFVSDDFSQSCNERFECRDSAGRLLGESDGHSIKLWRKSSETYETFSDPEKIQQTLENLGDWKRVLTIRFVLLKLTGVYGVWEFTTKGKESSLPQIRDTFDKVLCDAGTVRGVPFDLIVEKKKSNKPSEQSNVFPVVQLVPNLSIESVELLRGYVENNVALPAVLSESKIHELERGKMLPEQAGTE